MNKRLLILSNNMSIGGIERSLICFLDNLKNIYDIDIYLNSKTGYFLKDIPENIKILNNSKILNRFCAANENKKIQEMYKINKIKKIIILIFKFFKINKLVKFIGYRSIRIKNNYNLVINYHGLNEMCLKIALKMKNTKKLAMIHCDINKQKHSKKSIRLISRFDKIICVSKSCADGFKKKYPKLADKVDYLYNFTNIEEIKTKANEKYVGYPEGINIVSVSRLSEEKAHLRSLEIFKKLHNDGYRFNWHIVGDGDKRGKIEDYIDRNNMGEYITLYGSKSNPYPYIKSADIFYLGSYHEAAPMVYCEAMTLGIPVVTTNTRSANELVGENGFVCDGKRSVYIINTK